MSEPILELTNLHVRFPISGGGLLGGNSKLLHAVNGLDLTLQRGECLSIVGESGCGKSTTALAIMGLQPPTEGEIRFKGRPLTGPEAPSRKERAKVAQMVFQDPYASLNPRQTVNASLLQPLGLHGITGSEARDRVATILSNVGLTPEQGKRFPHEFSGGQRQRIGIARALILEPEIVLLDEPVSALDVSIRAQIINLLLDLQEQFNLSYLMISHDLSVVEHMSDRVLVMFFGQIVEQGGWQSIFENPRHPYTLRLLEAIPDPQAALNPERQVAKAITLPPPPPGWAFGYDGSTAPNVLAPPDASELVEVGEGHLIRLHRA